VAAAIQIDPIRVLRQHAWKIAAAAVIGVAIGGVAQVVCEFTYPLYSDTVLFELQQSPDEATDVTSRDDRTEETVERAGQTEAAKIVSRELLMKAMNNRDIEQTKWSEHYRDNSDRFVAEDAVDDLEDELAAGHQRRTNYVSLTWSTHVPSDVPIVLNRIADTYIAVKKAADDEKFEANRQTFDKQLKDLDAQLLSLAKEVGKFVSDHNMTSTNEERNEMLLARPSRSRPWRRAARRRPKRRWKVVLSLRPTISAPPRRTHRCSARTALCRRLALRRRLIARSSVLIMRRFARSRLR
jgi:uncharacterized protein involved in exopolysaccharide biosynthesis